MAHDAPDDYHVTHLAERDARDGPLHFRVYHPASHLAVDVEVDAALAIESKDARWWAEHGNSGMARYEALKWAGERARELGASLIRRHRRDLTFSQTHV